MVRKLIVVFLLVLFTGCSDVKKDPEAEKPTDENPVLVELVKLDKSELVLNVGDFSVLNATLSPSNATDKILKWTSTNNSIATVVDGKITGIKAGETVIRAETASGISAQCKVTVKTSNKVEIIKLVLITYHSDYLSVNFFFADSNDQKKATDANISLRIVNASNKQVFKKDYTVKETDFEDDILRIKIYYADIAQGNLLNDVDGKIFYQINTPFVRFNEGYVNVEGLPTLDTTEYTLYFYGSLPMPIAIWNFTHSALAEGLLEKITYYNIRSKDGFYIEFKGEVSEGSEGTLYIKWNFIVDGYVVRTVLTKVPDIEPGEKFSVGDSVYFPTEFDEYSIFEIEILNVDKSRLP
jgi:hypothetical protein